LEGKVDCKHYWVCGQPEDGYVKSVCRHCGEGKHTETLTSIQARKALAMSKQNDLSKIEDITDDSRLIALKIG